MFGDVQSRLGQIEHPPLLNARDHRRRQSREAMATRFRLVPLDDIRLCDLLQRAAGMSRLSAARLARLAARAAGDPRRLLQAVARRRLAAVRAVLVQLTPKLRDLLAQRRVVRPQNLNLAPQRANQSRSSGRRILHTLTHTSPPRVPKNRTPPSLFTKTVAHETHPQLGSCVIGANSRAGRSSWGGADEGCELGDCGAGNAEAGAEIVEEGNFQFLAGLGEAEHHVAGLAAFF